MIGAVLLTVSLLHLSRAEDTLVVPSCQIIDELMKSVEEFVLEKELIPDAVRLPFHGCVGGCNGCLNIDQTDNIGLQCIFNDVEKLVAENRTLFESVSTADLWSVIGVVAASAAIDNAAGSDIDKPCFDLFWGRKDCDTSPITSDQFEFPQPTMNSTQVFDYFRETFNLDVAETVAVMGAHNLGKAVRSNNGFHGVWTPKEEQVLDETYFENMIAKNLTYKNVDASAGRPNATEKHWQWEATLPNGDISMMLNTDLEIFFDLELAEDGKVVCTLDTNCIKEGTCGKDNICRKADTYEQGLEYTQDRARFYEDFKNAYTKMLQTNTTDLVKRGTTCSCSNDMQ